MRCAVRERSVPTGVSESTQVDSPCVAVKQLQRAVNDASTPHAMQAAPSQQFASAGHAPGTGAVQR